MKRPPLHKLEWVTNSGYISTRTGSEKYLQKIINKHQLTYYVTYPL